MKIERLVEKKCKIIFIKILYRTFATIPVIQYDHPILLNVQSLQLSPFPILSYRFVCLIGIILILSFLNHILRANLLAYPLSCLLEVQFLLISYLHVPQQCYSYDLILLTTPHFPTCILLSTLSFSTCTKNLFMLNLCM